MQNLKHQWCLNGTSRCSSSDTGAVKDCTSQKSRPIRAAHLRMPYRGEYPGFSPRAYCERKNYMNERTVILTKSEVLLAGAYKRGLEAAHVYNARIGTSTKSAKFKAFSGARRHLYRCSQSIHF